MVLPYDVDNTRVGLACAYFFAHQIARGVFQAHFDLSNVLTISWGTQASLRDAVGILVGCDPHYTFLLKVKRGNR